MKFLLVFWLLAWGSGWLLHAQEPVNQKEHSKEIQTLIDQYAQARETRDTLLLKTILTDDVDQLVSSGEWRRGKDQALAGMLRSSSRNPGGRTLIVENVRFMNSQTALVDARYEIQNADGTVRKMWSTFAVVYVEERWKISAIRNMLPSR